MDADNQYTLIFFAVIMGGILIVASYLPKPQPEVPVFQELMVYADMNMMANIGNSLWWSVSYPDVNYSKIVYVYNPNNYSVAIEVYLEAFPAEMSQYCRWGSDLSPSIGGMELVELRLWVLVEDNQFLGLSAYEGDVLTQIRCERP